MSAAAVAGGVAGAVVARNNRLNEEARQEAVRYEINALVRLMDKRAVFREAAQEMLEDIPALARIEGLSGPRALKIRPGFFSLRKKPVPPEIQEWANDHVRPLVTEKLGAVVENIRGDFDRALRNSVYNSIVLGAGQKFYKGSEFMAFYDGLDDEKLAALGKNGVMLTVIDDLFATKTNDDVLRGVKKSVPKSEDDRGLKTRTVVPTFQDMVVGVVGNIEMSRYSVTYPLRGDTLVVPAPEEP